MRAYSDTILENQSLDGEVFKVPSKGGMDPAAAEFEKKFADWSNEILTIVKSKHDDAEDAYDKSYRLGYLILGFSRVLRWDKVTRLLEILEFVLDYGRERLDFSQHSMTYVVELTLSTSKECIDEASNKKEIATDITDVISECRTYLNQVLFEHNSEIEKRTLTSAEKSQPDLKETTISSEAADELNQNTPSVIEPIPQIDDSPEELNIPADKTSLVSDFCEEATDNLNQVELSLIELEDSDEPIEVVNAIFRAVHTVKGGARLLEIKKIESLAHQMESLLDDVRSKKLNVSSEIVDILIEGNSVLKEMTENVQGSEPLDQEINPIVKVIYALRTGSSSPVDSKSEDGEKETKTSDSTPISKPEKTIAKTTEKTAGTNSGQKTAPTAEESIRVPANKLEEVLNTASEVFITRIRLENDARILADAINNMEVMTRDAKFPNVTENLVLISQKCEELELELIKETGTQKSTTSRSRRVLDRITKLLKDEIFQNLDRLPEESRLNLLRIEEARKQLQKNIEDLEGLSGTLQTGAMGFRMVPISQLFNRFPAQVRELARKVGKKAKLTINGGDTELDKLLINQLADPLVHILRNSLDHGFESSEERKAAGKSEIGEITISAFYHGSNAVIEVSDDGRGVNKNRVLEKAIEKELISEDQVPSMTEREILELIFDPGFSSAEVVTELSGRGVGMDVVKTSIAAVQGTVNIESTEGQGTKISMKLPLTLAIVGILLVSENGHQFAFPILNVAEVLTVKNSELKQVGDNMVFNYRGNTLKVNSLSKVLGFESSSFDGKELSVIVITDGDRTLGILVDEIKGQQDVLIKQFGSMVTKVNYMMGCTILSDSSLVLIINVWELFNANSTYSETPKLEKFEPDNQKLKRAEKKILVVDDSAIQRNRLNAMLTRAGYKVETAVDGHDGLKKASSTRFDAFCVDIVMPLMDGYEFLEQIRSNERFTNTPVFLVTGKNIDSGAETRRIQNLNVKRVFEKPVDETEILKELDIACQASETVEA